MVAEIKQAIHANNSQFLMSFNLGVEFWPKVEVFSKRVKYRTTNRRCRAAAVRAFLHEFPGILHAFGSIRHVYEMLVLNGK